MVDLVLDGGAQRALRTLLQLEPAPGMPPPTTSVLRAVLTLVHGDAIGVEVVDRGGHVVEETGVPAPGDGVVHGPVCDSLALGLDVGHGHHARLRVDRHRRRFDEPDAAIFHLVTPMLARLLRGSITGRLPASLTLQERRVLALVVAGRSNDEIAATLHVSPSTVRKHLEHAYRKLGVHSRLAAVAAFAGSRVTTSAPLPGPVTIRAIAYGAAAAGSEHSWDQHVPGGTPCSADPPPPSPSPSLSPPS